MVSKYDVFEYVYHKKKAVKASEVAKAFGKTKGLYNHVLTLLQELANDKYLVKSKHGFEGKVSDKAERLYRIIRYCIQNNMNYNLLLDQEFLSFVSDALRQGSLEQQRTKINPRRFRRYVDTLQKYGLLLTISEKPRRIVIFYNSLMKNLLLHFDMKPAVKRPKIEYNKLINKELVKFRRLRKLNPAGFEKIVEDLNISFVHHSLSLEGNPITLPDTYKILRQNIIPNNTRVEDVDEVRNYQKALLQMIKDVAEKNVLTEEAILRYHGLALGHHSAIAGKIRTVGVHIRGNPHFKIAKKEDIRPKLNLLMKKYEEFQSIQRKRLTKILAFAAYFHNEFQHIHPFVDGNSRTTRLLLFHILNSNHIPVFDLPLGLLDDYMNNTKKYTTRNDASLQEVIQEIVLFNLNSVNSRL